MTGLGKIVFVGGLALLIGALGCDDDDNQGTAGNGGAGGINSMIPDGGAGRGGGGGRGGVGGGAGGGGRGGAPSTTAIAYTFDSDLQGFAFDLYQDPMPGAVTNLAAPRPDGGAPAGDDGGATAADAGTPGPLGPPPTLEHDPAAGDPSPGSLKVTVPYTGFNQVVDAGRRLPVANVESWTGKTLRVKVRLTEGTFAGGAVLYVLTLNPPSPMYLYAASEWTPLQAGQWRELTLNLGAIPTADKIVGFGVQFGSGGPAVPGGTFTPATAVFHVDSLTD